MARGGAGRWKHASAGAALVILATVGVTGCGRPPAPGQPLAVVAQFGEAGLAHGQFSYPRCIDGDGESIWVIDKSARVQRLDPKTGAWEGGWRMPEWERGKPTGVTVWLPRGGDRRAERVFIPDTHYHRVMIYDPSAAAPGDDPNETTGHLMGQFGSYGEGDGQFIYLTDVAILPTADGKRVARLYVSEYGGHDRVNIFEPAAGASDDGPYEFKFAFGRFGSGAQADPVEFSRPQSLAIDLNRRELIVTDACNHRIGRFTLDGKLVAWIGGPDKAGSAPGELSYPYGLALLENGTVLVAEFGNNRVQHIDPVTGACLGVYGQAGRMEGQLASPWGIAVMGSAAYVLDSGNNRVQIFRTPTNTRPIASDQRKAGERG